MAYVYRHIRLDKNEPFYIGIGSAKNYYRAYGKDNRNKHWHNIVKNTNYEVDILFDNLDDDSARGKEIEFIKLYGRVDLGTGCLVNLTDGGDGCLNKIITKEVAKKMSDSHKGKKHTEECKKRLSEYHKKRLQDPEMLKKHKESRIGIKHKNPMSLEHRIKISENNKNRVITNETKKKMSKCKKTIILQYDLNGNFIKEWEGIIDAAKQYGKSTNISRCCQGKLKEVYGYIWKYKHPERVVKRNNKRNVTN